MFVVMLRVCARCIKVEMNGFRQFVASRVRNGLVN